MKKLYLFFLFVLATGAIDAAYRFAGANGTVTVECSESDLTAISSQMETRGLHRVNPTVQNLQTAPKLMQAPEAEQTLFNVTLDLLCDEEKGEFPDFNQMAWTSDGEYYYSVFPMMGEPIVFTLPEGTYDFMGVINAYDGKKIYVAKENVLVNADCTVTIESAEAVNLITFHPLLPDGSVMTLDNKDFDTDEIVSTGNLRKVFCGPTLFHKNNGSFSSSLTIGSSNSVLSDGTTVFDVFRNSDILINDTERFYFRFELEAVTTENEHPLGCAMQTDGTKSQELSNDIADYRHYSPSFAGAVLSELPHETEAGEAIYYKIDNECYVNLYMYPSQYSINWLTFSEDATNLFDYWICISLPETYRYTYFWTPSALLAVKDEWGITNYGIQCPAVIEENGIPQILPSQELAPNFPVYATTKPVGFYQEFNREFAFPYSDSFTFGNSCPLWVPYMIPGNSSRFGYNFICRANEFRSVDYLDHSIKYLADGNLIFDSYQQLTDEMWSMIPNWDTYKQIDIEVVNRNLKIDDRILINGQARIHLDVQSVIEEGYPLVTMLQFRDKEGAVTDRFASVEGTAMLSGAVFKMVTDDSYEWPQNYFVPSRLPEVKAEYSRHDRNEFQPLTLIVDEAVGLMPTYGWMYHADIAQLGTDAEEGWYDLRLTAADTHGNFIEQIVSPAFLIGQDDSGITDALISSDAVRVEGNRIVAPAGSRVLTLSGLPAATGDLPAGLYLVRTPDGRTAKVLVD